MEYSEENLKNTSTSDLKVMYDLVSEEATNAQFMYERSEDAITRLMAIKGVLKEELNKRVLNIFTR